MTTSGRLTYQAGLAGGAANYSGVVRVKSCPKCKGDVIVDRDEFGRLEECIQCGYLRYLDNEGGAEQHTDIGED